MTTPDVPSYLFIEDVRGMVVVDRNRFIETILPPKPALDAPPAERAAAAALEIALTTMLRIMEQANLHFCTVRPVD